SPLCIASPATRTAPASRNTVAGRRMASPPYSALPLRTIESRPPGLHDALDGAAAVATRTGLALASVDRPLMLEIAKLARGLNIVAQGRAAGADGPAQHLADRPDQALGALALHRRGETARRQAGPVEALRDVDV